MRKKTHRELRFGNISGISTRKKIFERMCAKKGNKNKQTNKHSLVSGRAKKISLSRIFCADNENNFRLRDSQPKNRSRLFNCIGTELTLVFVITLS